MKYRRDIVESGASEYTFCQQKRIAVQCMEISCLVLPLMESANWLVNNDMRGTASRSRDRNQRGLHEQGNARCRPRVEMQDQDVFKRD